MSGLLSIALSSMTAYKRALDITGNNLANINTPGYSRQYAHFAPRQGQFFAGSFIGSGVTIDHVQRYSDYYANQNVQSSYSNKSQYDAFYQQASRLDSLLGSKDFSVSKSMQELFTALGKLNGNPADMAARGVVFKQSQLLVDQYHNLQAHLDDEQKANSAKISQTVDQINNLTGQIGEFNQQILLNPGAMDLLDQRDQLVKDLSGLIDINANAQPDGTMNVSTGSGQMLVLGGNVNQLKVTSDATEIEGTHIGISNGSSFVDITQQIKSGSLGGLMDYSQTVLKPASQLLGQMAIGLAQTFNTQHHLGIDLNNQYGKDFFNDFNTVQAQLDRASPANTNTGTATLSVAISDISATQLSDYQLVVSDSGSNEVRLIRKSDGQSTTLNWSSNPPAPPAGQLQFEGMTIQVDDIAKLANNDNYTLSPTSGAARNLAFTLENASQIALASPVRVGSPTTNTGNGAIELGTVFNTTAVNKDFRIEFISPTQYNLVNVTDSVTTGPLTFTPNAKNTIQIPDSTNPSYTVVLSGSPAAGDQFTTGFNSNGAGNNNNGLALAGIQNLKFLDGGKTSLFDAYANLVTDVGSKTYGAKISGEAADILYKQAVDFRESVSGVNLDEEVGNLMMFQQAYQAAGQLMAVSSQLMDVLFSAMR